MIIAVRSNSLTTWRGRFARYLPDVVYRSLKYRIAFGVWPRLREPRRYTEKMTWRILHDRRPILAWTCDKLASKDEVARRAPDVRSPAVLWSGADLRGLMGVDLPDRWVLKPNNSSGRALFGSGRVDAAAVARLSEATADWLDGREFRRLREWAYSQARPILFVEQYLGHETSPTDIKIFVFDGVPRMLQVVEDRFTERRLSTFTPDWTYVPMIWPVPNSPELARPAQLDGLLDAAARIGRGFDHMRVDLYLFDDEIWFGELTTYSWSGLDPIDPVELDYEWGEWWQLPVLDRAGHAIA